MASGIARRAGRQCRTGHSRRRWRANDWHETDGFTTLTFPINPIASVFVVFRPAATATAPMVPERTLTRETAVENAWIVSFPAKFAPNPLASPSGRLTFTTWRHWLKDDKPLASGLLGPVKQLLLRFEQLTAEKRG